MQILLDYAWQYNQFYFFLKTLSLATKFREIISIYIVQQETGNVMNNIEQKLRNKISLTYYKIAILEHEQK